MRSASPLRTLLRCGCPPRRTADTHLRHVNDRRVYGGAGQFYAPSTVTGLFAGSSQRALAPSLRRRSSTSAPTLTVPDGSLFQHRLFPNGAVRRSLLIPPPVRTQVRSPGAPSSRANRASSAPNTTKPASTVSGTSTPVESSITPVKAGPAKPPRLPTAAISAIPAAPAEPLRKAAGAPRRRGSLRGVGQGERDREHQQHRRLHVGGQPGAHRAPISAGTMTQGRRLGARLARRATTSIVAVDIPYGIAAKTPTSKSL
jgi:hypothetical protein